LDELGGTLSIEEQGNPLCGVSVTLPKGAVHHREHVTVRRGELPATLPEGALAMSPVLVLEKSTDEAFSLPVTVTVPCSPTVLATHAAVPVYWDPEGQRYRGVALHSVTPRSITFVTAHFTMFLAAGVPRGSWDALNVDTGFDPKKDAFPFENGDLAGVDLGRIADITNASWCLGMSLMATWYYDARGPSTPHLREVLMKADHGRAEDLTGREMAAFVQQDYDSAYAHHRRPLDVQACIEGLRLGPLNTLFSGIHAMKVTHEPQMLGVVPLTGDGHEVILTGYKNGKILAYDPNFPDRTVSWDFNLETGLGHFSEGDDVYGPIRALVLESPSNFGRNSDFKSIFDTAVAERGGQIAMTSTRPLLNRVHANEPMVPPAESSQDLRAEWRTAEEEYVTLKRDARTDPERLHEARARRDAVDDELIAAEAREAMQAFLALTRENGGKPDPSKLLGAIKRLNTAMANIRDDVYLPLAIEDATFEPLLEKNGVSKSEIDALTGAQNEASYHGFLGWVAMTAELSKRFAPGSEHAVADPSHLNELMEQHRERVQKLLTDLRGTTEFKLLNGTTVTLPGRIILARQDPSHPNATIFTVLDGAAQHEIAAVDYRPTPGGIWQSALEPSPDGSESNYAFSRNRYQLYEQEIAILDRGFENLSDESISQEPSGGTWSGTTAPRVLVREDIAAVRGIATVEHEMLLPLTAESAGLVNLLPR
jgi:hypothetical protein